LTTRIGWGILGCGWIATKAIAPAIERSNGGRLVAVASRTPDVAAAKARETGAARAYAPYDAMLDDPDVDAVYIGLPNGLHDEWALRSAQAGKHVLCEKALTMTLASARRMAGAFTTRGLRLVEAFMYRHHPQWPIVLDLLAQRAIGTPHVVRASFCGRWDKPLDHRWSAALGGGALWDLTCYGVDVVRYLTRAEPFRATAIAESQTSEGVDESTQASLELPGGILASVTGSLRAGPDQSLMIAGEEGSIEVARPFVPDADPALVVLRRKGSARFAEERRFEVEGANHFLLQVEHFASLVLDAKRPTWPAEDGVRNVAVCEAIEKSWRRKGSAVAVEV
jgi:xylose dehydrogenase (NAD/NADP)